MDSEATERLSAWLDSQRIEVGEPLVIEPLVGGTSNVMYAVDRGDYNWVLRRPPKMAIERANEGMRREFRILEALEQTEVPHPGAVALCDDESVLGCTFYLMQRVDGRNPFPEPPGFESDARRAEITHAMIDALVRVHEVRYEAVGLGDLGHPDKLPPASSRTLESPACVLRGQGTGWNRPRDGVAREESSGSLHPDTYARRLPHAKHAHRSRSPRSRRRHSRLGDGNNRGSPAGPRRLLRSLVSLGQCRLAHPRRDRRALLHQARNSSYRIPRLLRSAVQLPTCRTR